VVCRAAAGGVDQIACREEGPAAMTSTPDRPTTERQVERHWRDPG
jgi:hypothetical protein